MQKKPFPHDLDLDGWFVRRIHPIKAVMRIIFGIFWLIDGIFKFSPVLAQAFPTMVKGAAYGQPAWLAGWFSGWSSIVSSNPAFFVYSTGIVEVFLAFCIIAGFMRKTSYAVTFFVSLLIWSVPEGFGGPYGPGSTDIGTGIVYALTSFLLLIINAIFGPSKYSLDYWIEKKFPRWRVIAEVSSKYKCDASTPNLSNVSDS